MLTTSDLDFLRTHFVDFTARECVPPVSPRIQSLVDRGYLQFVPMRCGPLGMPDVGTWVRLTEAGRQLLVTIEASEGTEPEEPR